MKPAPFQYHAPTTVDDAVQLLAELGDEAKVLAGGQSLVPMLNLRLARFEHLVDIGRIGELRGIERRNGSLVIAAGTRDSVIEFDETIAGAVPLLAAVTPLIGHFQIRNRGTIGGSLAHADPAAEYPAVAVALDATFDIVSAGGSRSVPASEFFDGVWSTSLEDGELLRSVAFPVWSGRSGFGVAEFARRHGDFALAGAVIAVQVDSDDKISRCGIGLIGMGSTPERPAGAEAAILGRPAAEVDADEVGRLAVADLDSIPSDLHGSDAYRSRVGAAMVSRAWTRAITEALGA